MKDLRESVDKYAENLQAAADMWMPSYREWCALLQAPAERVMVDVTRPTEVPWRDWHRLIVWERGQLDLERGLLALDRERFEAERPAR